MANFALQLVNSIAGASLARALLLLIISVSVGCTTRQSGQDRPFSFATDTFSYANQLKWEYDFNEAGEWKATQRQPAPDYTLHCFVVARSAKQFFQNARFVPALPREDQETNRKLIRRVIRQNPRRPLPSDQKIIIPGYANLRDFSRENERALKEECGGAWQSYLQRGNWRMVLPFSRSGQEKEAEKLAARIEQNHAPVVHIVRFPSLSVNHALLLFDTQADDRVVKFFAYDPNKPEAPSTLTYHRSTRTFSFPKNDYFIGGDVNVYEVYESIQN